MKPSKIIRALEQGREIRAQRAEIIDPKNMKPTIEPGWVIITPTNQKRFAPKRVGDEIWCAHKKWEKALDNGIFYKPATYRRRIVAATTQQPKPTNKELAVCCGLSEQAYQQVKHLTMGQLVSVASLFGTRLRMGLVPREKTKKGKPKQGRIQRKLIIKFRNVVRRDVEMKNKGAKKEMKPFYQDQLATIWHADCREILPTLPKVDLVLTDPPYGINRDGQKRSGRNLHVGRKFHQSTGWDSEPPSAELFRWMFAKSDDQIIWGANYFTKHLPPSMGWLVWDKGQDINSSDCELAYSSRDAALRRKVMNRCELTRDGTNHPTQKPLALMLWCLSLFPDAQSILDPFMGSGTTLVAAKQLGRKAIGIELEEKYCEIAAKRLQQEYLTLTVEQPRRNEQAELLTNPASSGMKG